MRQMLVLLTLTRGLSGCGRFVAAEITKEDQHEQHRAAVSSSQAGAEGELLWADRFG
jgi:uncharacterized protein YceK